MAETMVKAKMTEEEFLRLPDDGRKYELVDGEAIEVPAGIEHDAIAAHLIVLFAPLVKGIGVLCASSAGYRMVTGNIRSPDVSFIRKERLPEGKLPKGFADFPPDLAVEVISPHEDWAELGRKLGEYFATGVGQVWLVDPEAQTVTVYRSLTDVRVFHADEELDGGELLPGFRRKVIDLISVGMA